MNLPAKRVQAILLRAWRGDAVVELAAALQIDHRQVEAVLRSMADRLMLIFPPSIEAAKVNTPLPKPEPYRPASIEDAYRDFAAGRVTFYVVSRALGLHYKSLALRFAAMGDAGCAARVERDRASNLRWSRGARTPREVMGRARKDAPQDLVAQLHAEWRAGRVTIQQAGDRLGLSRPSVRLRFAEIGDDQAYLDRRKRGIERRMAKAKVKRRAKRRVANPKPRAVDERPDPAVETPAKPVPTAEPHPGSRPRTEIPQDKLLLLYAEWKDRKITLDQVAERLGVAGSTVSRRFAAIDNLGAARARALQTNAASDTPAEPPAPTRLVRVEGREVALPAARQIEPPEAFTPAETNEQIRARTEAVMRAEDERRRRALLAEPPDPRVLALMERRAMLAGEGQDARDAIDVLRREGSMRRP